MRAARLLGFCYFCAFVSLYLQYEGLLSYNGLLPVDIYIARIREKILKGFYPLSSPIWETVLHILKQFGSLVAIHTEAGLTPDAMSELLILIGIITSSIITLMGSRHNILFFICWACYLSLQQVGQTWLSFQWDILLLEVGFLATFSSSCTRHNRIPFSWCYRFLAWKLMFLSGLVKLQSQCPAWESLTALQYHFATQCLPTPVAWLAHQLPPLILKAFVAITFLIEIPWTALLLVPFRPVRRLGAGLQILFQLSIIATGNYTFFNLLTIALMLEVWADDDGNNSLKCTSSLLSTLLTSAAWLYMAWTSALFFSLDEAFWTNLRSDEWWTGAGLTLKLKWAELSQYTLVSCATATYFSCAMVLFYTARGIAKHRRPFLGASDMFTAALAIGWILLSATCFKGIADTRRFLPPQILDMAASVQNYHLVSPYGLFRSMTGVQPYYGRGTTPAGYRPALVIRPEIVIEALDPTTQRWEELHFLHKPGDVFAKPTWIAPYQPRLDWQMWFAALGSYAEHPWLIFLAYKLMVETSNSSVTWQLLDKNKAPFADKPTAIRMTFYQYDFTRWNTSWARATPLTQIVPYRSNGTAMSAWYARIKGHEYLPALDTSNESLFKFMQGMGIEASRALKVRSRAKRFKDCLRASNGRNKVVQSALCYPVLLRNKVAYARQYFHNTILKGGGRAGVLPQPPPSPLQY